MSPDGRIRKTLRIRFTIRIRRRKYIESDIIYDKILGEVDQVHTRPEIILAILFLPQTLLKVPILILNTSRAPDWHSQ